MKFCKKKTTVRARELQIPPEAGLYLDRADWRPKVNTTPPKAIKETRRPHQDWHPRPQQWFPYFKSSSVMSSSIVMETLERHLVRSSTAVFRLETAACCLVNCSFERFNKLSMKWCNGLWMTGKCTTEINLCVNVSSSTKSCCWKTADRLKESSKINNKARNKAVNIMTLPSVGALEG